LNKFDGCNPSAWVTQMEHYFSLHGITNDMTKLKVAVLYLDPERWQWWEWHKKSSKKYIAWSQFVTILLERFERDTHYLGRLTKLRQINSVTNFISAFEMLTICTENLNDSFYKECFISGLKEEIQAYVRMHHSTTWLEATQRALEAETMLNAQMEKPSFTNHNRPPPINAPSTNHTQPWKVQNLSPSEMADRQKRGLCYNCDEKYNLGHKCKEHKLFHIDATSHT